MTAPYTLWALPGFLGLPADWQPFELDGLKSVDNGLFPSIDFAVWAGHFNHFVEKQSPQPAIVMGYSLGGRLALHALCQRPALWEAAIIISAHPGLKQIELKQERLERDEAWAKRFLEEPWDRLMEGWNKQEVFAQDACRFQRQESNYQRAQLAACLQNFSLGRQEDLRGHIRKLPMPVLWIVGEKDRRFCELAKTVAFQHPLSSLVVMQQAGHRAPWAQPEAFKQSVQDFLRRIKKDK